MLLKMDSGQIRDIVIDKPSTWRNKLFITFDFDWANDMVILNAVEILKKHKIKATFFCTHKTKLLELINEDPLFDVGIHPNFNPLINPESDEGKTVSEIIDDLLKIVPHSMVVRSHSLLQSTRISDLFVNRNLRFECNTYVPYSSGIVLKPYLVGEMIKIPHFWEDDLYLRNGWKWSFDDIQRYAGLKVFDFHPIHVFLNTENMERYEKIKGNQHDLGFISRNINRSKKPGIGDFLVNLIKNIL